MDKRWIYILIIAIIGISCMFLIVESSTTIGKATVKVDNFLITIPDSFNIHNDGSDYADLINRKTNERILVKDLGKGDRIEEKMSEVYESYSNNESYYNVKNVTVNDTIPTIYYEDYNNTINQINFITKFNHTFSVKSSHFHDNATIEENAEFIIDSLVPNYKQKQDD